MTETKGEPGIRQLPGPCWTVLAGDEGAGFEGAMYHYRTERLALADLPSYRRDGEELDDDDRKYNASLRVAPIADVVDLVCWEAYLLCGTQYVCEADEPQSHFTDRDEVLSMIAEDGLVQVMPWLYACDSDICEVCVPVRRQLKQQMSESSTDPDVSKRGDPVTDPTTIDWVQRRRSAVIPFQIVDGRPVNPYGRHLPYGRGRLGHWGEKRNADAAVFVTVDGVRFLLLGERDDGNGWALPGGGLEDGETPLQGGLRELFEETGIRIDPAKTGILPLRVRYVDDPRASREAWMVTTPIVIGLGTRDELPETVCHSDLTRCAWAPTLGGLPDVEAYLAGRGGKLFESHRRMLTEILGAVQS